MLLLLVVATACGAASDDGATPDSPVPTDSASPSTTLDERAASDGVTTTEPSEPARDSRVADPSTTTSTLDRPSAELSGDAGVRTNPIALGSFAPIGNWLVRVTGAEPDGSDLVAASSEFNEAPQPGEQYFVIGIEAVNAGVDSSSFWIDNSWSAVGDSALAYDPYEATCGTIEDDPTYLGEVWPGGVIEGTLCFAVSNDDAASLQLIVEEGFGTDDRMFFALHDGVGSPTSVEAVEPPPIEVGGGPGTRGDPIAQGEFADLGEWFVRVDAVALDATAAILESSVFAEPPAPGSQYLLVDLTVGYFGDEIGVGAGSLNFQLLGPDNVATGGWNSGCGFIDGELSSMGDLYPGGSVSGSACFEVSSEHASSMQLYADSFGFDRERAFFDLAGGGTETGVELPPAPAVNGGPEGSWANPMSAGSIVEVGDWSIRVIGLERDATGMVLDESRFNEPPAPGFQFALVTLEATYVGTDSGSIYGELTWGLLGRERVEYTEFSSDCGTIPDSLSNAPEVFPGGVVTGNICLVIDSGAADELVLVLEDFVSFDGAHFVALD